ncbi:unnamed protein product [Leuciscus chuanchicus]
MAFFSAIIYVYFEPTVNWLNCPAVPKHDVCGNICINALKTPNQIQIVNNTCMVNFTSLRHQLTQTEAASSQGGNLDTILLIWMWPFGHPFDLGLCSSMYDIHGCHLTVNKSQFNKAHGVLFHHRDINGDLSNMLKLPRPPFQKWVWMNMESPSNSGQRSNLNNLFNLTTTYRQDSDIMVPYGCKFYLSFENSIHKDYITEKLYNPLSLGTVPVVLGPPRKNYEEFISGSAFIHVDDFNSPKEAQLPPTFTHSNESTSLPEAYDQSTPTFTHSYESTSLPEAYDQSTPTFTHSYESTSLPEA